MTSERIRLVRRIAAQRKGLSEETYRLMLGRRGQDKTGALTRDQFYGLLADFKKLPDVPGWKKKR